MHVGHVRLFQYREGNHEIGHLGAGVVGQHRDHRPRPPGLGRRQGDRRRHAWRRRGCGVTGSRGCARGGRMHGGLEATVKRADAQREGGKAGHDGVVHGVLGWCGWCSWCVLRQVRIARTYRQTGLAKRPELPHSLPWLIYSEQHERW